MAVFLIKLGLSGVLAVGPGDVTADDGASLEFGDVTQLPETELETWSIINGEDAATDDYPMTGGMLMDATVTFGASGGYDMRMFVCSSTLIAPDESGKKRALQSGSSRAW